MKNLPLGEVYRLLEPGPVILLTTSDKNKSNIMTQSWHLMMEFEPPLVGLIVSNRNHSFRALKRTKECVINIPTEKLIRAVVGCGNTSGSSVDKFKKYSLTPLPATAVQAPLIKECFASLECKVVNTQLVNEYCFFVVQVLKAWSNPSIKKPKTLHHCGNGVFMIAGKTKRTKSKMK